MTKRTQTTAVLILSVLSVYLAGCSDKFLDPTQIGRFRPVPAVNVILDSLGVAEEEPPTWRSAEPPRPADVIAKEGDYILSEGDVVRISIFELFEEGAGFISEFVVNETGKVSIAEVGIVEAAGLTESQLEEEIKRIVSPSILKEPLVSVTLLSSERRTFSILGDGITRGVGGRFTIPRYDFRLTDALAMTGGLSQFNVSNIYVSRPITGEEAMAETIEPKITEPEKPKELIEPEKNMLEIIAPRAERRQSDNRLVIASAEMVTDRELTEAASPEGFGPPANGRQNQIQTVGTPESSDSLSDRETIGKPINEMGAGHIEWIFQDGKWIPVQIGRPKPTEPAVKVEPEKAAKPLKEKVPAEFEWGQVETGGMQTRVIEIPIDKLFGGDYRYNIVIKPGDTINVPVDIIGEFCIMGNVAGVGYIPITGRQMTLKMAIAAAGGLGPLAWPKRCEVTRRIGKNKEETVMVDLDKIASGEQPDFFIKPNDLINVGTHPTARWRAVLRNAFRISYGFGFIYDRNFAERDFGISAPLGPFGF